MSKCVLMNMCMIFDNANQVLVQDKVHSRWAGITFPGGHIDDGESIYESAIREVKEETGLTISNLKQAGLIHMFNTERQERRIIFLYKTSCFEGEMKTETDEGKVFWAPLNELGNLKLAPNVREYYKVFMDNDISEAYIESNKGFTQKIGKSDGAN